MSDLVNVEEIEAAAERLVGVAVRTPLVRLPGTPLWLKPESLQPVGSFKLRGAYAAISGLPDDERALGVIAHSSGNHAQAVAYAAQALNIPAVLVLPTTAPTVKVDACRRLGAEVVFVEPTMSARVNTSTRLAEAHGYTLIPPFDDRRVIAGQGTIGLEILADAPETDAVLVPVSGGGLISGIAVAIKSQSPETRVVGVEPELAADARESFREGMRVAWDPAQTARTMADGLRVERVGALTFAHVQEYVDDIVTVTEDQIRAAMHTLAFDARLVAEPSGAVTTAAYLAGVVPAEHPVAIVSGGNIDPVRYTTILTGH